MDDSTTNEDVESSLRAIDWELGDIARRIEDLREQVRALEEVLKSGGDDDAARPGGL